MEPKSTSSQSARVDRELATLKLVSRLLGHELHAQAGQRLQFSRDEVTEIQSAVDLFIARFTGTRASTPLASVETNSPTAVRSARSSDTSPVEARMN